MKKKNKNPQEEKDQRSKVQKLHDRLNVSKTLSRFASRHGVRNNFPVCIDSFPGVYSSVLLLPFVFGDVSIPQVILIL